VRAASGRRPHGTPDVLKCSPLHLSHEATQCVRILSRQAIRVGVRAATHRDRLSTSVTGVQVGVGQPFPLYIAHAQNGIAIQRPTNQRVTVGAGQARGSTVVVILPSRLRVPVAKILTIRDPIPIYLLCGSAGLADLKLDDASRDGLAGYD
jgi:hypothetical protein